MGRASVPTNLDWHTVCLQQNEKYTENATEESRNYVPHNIDPI